MHAPQTPIKAYALYLHEAHCIHLNLKKAWLYQEPLSTLVSKKSSRYATAGTAQTHMRDTFFMAA